MVSRLHVIDARVRLQWEVDHACLHISLQFVVRDVELLLVDLFSLLLVIRLHDILHDTFEHVAPLGCGFLLIQASTQ